jgi:hypothetical protein
LTNLKKLTKLIESACIENLNENIIIKAKKRLFIRNIEKRVHIEKDSLRVYP